MAGTVQHPKADHTGNDGRLRPARATGAQAAGATRFQPLLSELLAMPAVSDRPARAGDVAAIAAGDKVDTTSNSGVAQDGSGDAQRDGSDTALRSSVSETRDPQESVQEPALSMNDRRPVAPEASRGDRTADSDAVDANDTGTNNNDDDAFQNAMADVAHAAQSEDAIDTGERDEAALLESESKAAEVVTNAIPLVQEFVVVAPAPVATEQPASADRDNGEAEQSAIAPSELVEPEPAQSDGEILTIDMDAPEITADSEAALPDATPAAPEASADEAVPAGTDEGFDERLNHIGNIDEAADVEAKPGPSQESHADALDLAMDVSADVDSPMSPTRAAAQTTSVLAAQAAAAALSVAPGASNVQSGVAAGAPQTSGVSQVSATDSGSGANNTGMGTGSGNTPARGEQAQAAARNQNFSGVMRARQEDTVRQVAKAIGLRAAMRSEGRVSLLLRPEHLGALKLHLSYESDGRLRVDAVTDNAAARHLLTGATEELRASLRREDIDLSRFNVDYQSQEGNGQNSAAHGGRGSRDGSARQQETLAGENGVSAGGNSDIEDTASGERAPLAMGQVNLTA